ncbi:hypothetical protein BH24DEI2_BH24DEI2_05190 [soil metagenome]
MTLKDMVKNGLVNNWPQKLGALALAAFMWYFVNLSNTDISQGTFTVPVAVEGVSTDQVPSGVPETIEVIVSGPSRGVNRLTPERIDATLDLSGVSGSFQRPILVSVPQDISILNRIPSEAVGTVETVGLKTVPVEVGLLGGGDGLLVPSYAPTTATVRGRSSVLERVAGVVATVQPEAGEQEVALYTVSDTGKPVSDPMLSVDPPVVTVNLTEAPILYTKTLPLSVVEPDLEPFVLASFALSQDRVRVAGPKEVLDTLSEAPGSIQLDTPPTAAGEYTLQVSPQLPDGVAALETVSAQITLEPPAPPPGDTNDLPDSPVRRPGATQNGEPGNLVR